MDFYIQASKILSQLDNKKGSIKGLTLHSGEKSGSRTYALILETLKYRDVLQEVIIRSELLNKERKLAAQGDLALILVHDLLLNKRGIVANSGPFKDAVLRHKTRLNAEWIKSKVKLRVKNDTDLAKIDSTFLPRWARINTLKCKTDDLLAELAEFKLVEKLENLEPKCLYRDEHVNDLLAFSPQESLANHKLYLDGRLIFQNKASCIPAVVLNPPTSASVIDACAAPGNKTTHLAALLNNNGKLFAFERDERRHNVLKSMLEKAGANADVIHGDFTRADPNEPRFANVTHLLLDPSCSGSGIVNRLDYLTETTSHATDSIENDTRSAVMDQDRLDSLSSFQLALLLHAMKFPAAEKITYSTCSVHAVENEHVVLEALRKSPGWRVCARSDSLPKWPNRGLVDECAGDVELADGLIRAAPGSMGTIGFFVACLVRQRKKRTLDDTLFVADDEADACTRSNVPHDETAELTASTSSNNVRMQRKKKKKKKKKTKSLQAPVISSASS